MDIITRSDEEDEEDTAFSILLLPTSAAIALLLMAGGVGRCLVELSSPGTLIVLGRRGVALR